MATSPHIAAFDPAADFTILERRLPHWSQAGVVCFATFRTQDSMPRDVVHAWQCDRMAWLQSHSIDPRSDSWRQQVQQLNLKLRREYYRKFSDRWQKELDRCHGECVLADSQLSEIVAKSLHYFDGDRYELTDFIVMPNHVHLLAAFEDDHRMLKQMESWKHYTAVKINRCLGRRGRFWRQDGFDHLIRSLQQFEAKRKYIAENGRAAGLFPGQYHHYSKPLGGVE